MSLFSYELRIEQETIRVELWLYSRTKEHQHETYHHRCGGRCQWYLHNLVLRDGRLERPDLGYFFVRPIGEVRMSQANGPGKDQHDTQNNHKALHARYLTTKRRSGAAAADTPTQDGLRGRSCMNSLRTY